MAEVDAVYDEVEDDYDLAFTHTVVWGMDVVGPMGAYRECLGVADVKGQNAYRASASVGLTYSINEDTILDAGSQIGLNRAAADIILFVGITLRF